MANSHGPNRLENYRNTHETVMEQFRRDGFVVSDDLVFLSFKRSIVIEGRIECLGNIFIDVNKTLKILTDDRDPLVQTTQYTYNVVVRGVGNLCRHDSPHPTHRKFHHIHRYDVLNGDTKGTVEPIEDWYTLGAVIDETRTWYWANVDRLESST